MVTPNESHLHQATRPLRRHQHATCDLCGLPIDGEPITKTYDDAEKAFCCQGCANVYDLAYQNDMVDQVVQQSQGHKPSAPLKDFFVESGETAYFALDGMWCAGCAVAAERVLRNQPGIHDVEVSFAAERGRIRYDPDAGDPTEALGRLDALGYRGRLLTDRQEEQTSRQEERTLLQLIVAAAFGMQVMLLYLVQLYPRYGAGDFGAPDVRKLEYLVWLLATPVMIYGGSSFLRGAWRALRAGTATMDTLVAIGTLSAYGYSVFVTISGRGEVYFDSVAMITTFVMVGRYLEAVGGAQARKDIRSLLQLQPQTAWRQNAAQDWEKVKAAALNRGDLILVKPGERVPADAHVVEGIGSANEAMLTGESAPVAKAPGDHLYAGTTVNDTAFQARVENPTGESRLAQITHLVEETLSAKPPIQRMADRASATFAVGILIAAGLTVIVRIAIGRPAAHAILAGVAVLVVACPCALGLATPLALTVALGRASRNGVLIRKPAALETAAHISRLVFDKTGTLTRGHLHVIEARPGPSSRLSPDALLCLAAAVEQGSEHPVGRAIVTECANGYADSQGFQAVPGQGVQARISGYEALVKVGSAPFVGTEDDELSTAATAHRARGETVVWVGDGQTVVGIIALGDEPNPTATETLSRLGALKVIPVMLSGDAARTTEAIAARLGLSEAEGGLSPQEKAHRIQTWQEAGTKVAMVGDGVNDAPALAQADLSITVVTGTDVAGETSDLILMQDDLTLIPWMLQLSRRTNRVIKENLGWAFAYNLLAVPLAAFGLISPVIAAAAMATSSLLVVGNSLRLRR